MYNGAIMKYMALILTMFTVMSCHVNDDNDFVKDYSYGKVYGMAFCSRSEKQKCIAYFKSNCNNGSVDSITEQNNGGHLITVSGYC